MRQLCRVLFVAAFASSTSAWAAPGYLTCSFGQAASDINITVDEAAGSASVTVPSMGSSFNMRASFTADKISFNENGVYYDLDRVSLKLVRTVRQYGFIDRGQCSVVKAPKRAI